MRYPWGGDLPLYTYHQYLNNTFGFQIRKLPVDAGFTCPNRDGKVGIGGCTFCLNEAFTPQYCNNQHDIIQQINDGLSFHAKRRRKIDSFFIYFQSFSNTYAPLEKLKLLFEEAAHIPDVKGLIIATRPDCLNEEILDYLSTLQEHIYINIEIGIESLHDETLCRVNRGHNVDCTLQAIRRLTQRNIPTCGHLIFGLPGEKPEMWLKDLATINNLSLTTLKLHQLQILHNTAIEHEYEEHPEDFYIFTTHGYIDFLADYIERLTPTVAIERLANEVPPRYLTTKAWQGIRHQDIVDGVIETLTTRKSWQGKFITPDHDDKPKEKLPSHS
ncbi:MAG: TIGR01212 family radical SAM protein [Bacteroidales bacterium]|nr:TIGR01212 family radical SAM protein [Bacteroidales bacterium]